MGKDFKYNDQDVNQLKGAFNSLVEDEKVGFWVGVGGFGYTNFLLSKFTKSSNLVIAVSSVLAGVVFSNIYSHQARATYGRVAARVNSHASLTINKLMEY